EGLADDQGGAEQDQGEADIVDGQDVEGIEREQQRDRAGDAGNDRAGAVELEQQAIDADQHEDVGEVRVGDGGQQLDAPVGLVALDSHAGRPQGDLALGQRDGAAVDRAQECGNVGRQVVDDL